MKKKFIIIGAIIILGLVLLTALNGNKPTEAQNQTQSNEPKADKVEVFVFHATQRCISCVTIGKFAGETVAEFFQPEMRDKKIEFREINIDLPENRDLAQKFQASGSALFINAIYDGQDHITEDTQVWRLTSNETQFKSYLKNKLNTLFGK
jgi:hypothetical protein